MCICEYIYMYKTRSMGKYIYIIYIIYLLKNVFRTQRETHDSSKCWTFYKCYTMNACSWKLAHALLRVPIIIRQIQSKQMTFIPSFWHLPPAKRWVPHVVWFLPVCSCPLRFWPLELPSPSGSSSSSLRLRRFASRRSACSCAGLVGFSFWRTPVRFTTSSRGSLTFRFHYTEAGPNLPRKVFFLSLPASSFWRCACSAVVWFETTFILRFSIWRMIRDEFSCILSASAWTQDLLYKIRRFHL